MKPYILLVILSAITTSLSAQNFSIGVNGGAAYNEAIKNTSPHTDVSQQTKPLAVSPVYSLRGMYLHNNWQIGLSVDYRRSSYRTAEYKGTVLFGKWIPETQFYETISGSIPFYPVSFFVNRKIPIGRFEIYGGISAGYVLIGGLNTSGESLSQKISASMPFNKNNYYGLSSGLQLGCTYFIAHNLGINAELCGDYVTFNQGATSASYTYSFPLTMGIRYRF